MGNETKSFGFVILFFVTLLSYTELKTELVALAVNATLTNAGIRILNTMFGLIWALLAVLWLALAVFYAMK